MKPLGFPGPAARLSWLSSSDDTLCVEAGTKAPYLISNSCFWSSTRVRYRLTSISSITPPPPPPPPLDVLDVACFVGSVRRRRREYRGICHIVTGRWASSSPFRCPNRLTSTRSSCMTDRGGEPATAAGVVWLLEGGGGGWLQSQSQERILLLLLLLLLL